MSAWRCRTTVRSFRNGISLIDPDDFFDPVNISIDGITEGGVRDAPTFRDASSDIDRFLRGQVVVTHTHFDGVAIHQAAG